MSASATRAGRGAATPLQRVVPFGIGLLAVVQLGTAAWMLLWPHGFHNSVGAFGPYNGHYLRDAMTLFAGIGIALALSLRWPALRTGALTAATAAIGLHAVNHWVDLTDDLPGTGAGIVGALSQTSLTLVAGLLLYASATAPGDPPDDR